jgi:glucan phosphoethanolaminetransferase (alkaline phosphatase superfamily)
MTQKALGELFEAEPIAALVFALSLTLCEPLFLTVSYRRYLASFQRHEYAIACGAFFVILISFAWAALFFWASFTSTYRMRAIYFALFAFAAFVEYGYQNAFARFTNVEDLRVALFDATAEQWRGSILAFADWRAALPCLAYAVLLVKFRNNRRASWKTLGLVLLLVASFYSAVSPYISGQFSTVSLNAFFRTAIITPWKLARGYRGPREELAFHSDQRPQNNVVLIVDESVRGDHLSINGYARSTTPYLEELLRQGMLHTWGITSAGTTCSTTSGDLILTGMTPSEFPDPGYQERKLPSIFQYAKAMGYETHYLDAQKETFWLGTPDDRNYVDDWQPVSRFPVANLYERDALIAQRIVEIVDGSMGHFIWVIKRGVHYPYSSQFPAAATKWQPAQTDSSDMYEIDPGKREQLVNTYDNALKYNLDSFFRGLDIPHRRNRNFFVYTSDHGQTLSEHGERHTHCRNSALTDPTEAAVPLCLITVEPLAVDTQYRASHANIFATLLDLMGVPKLERRHEYALSLLGAKATDSKPRYFFVGDLHERATSALLPFDR